MADKQFVGGCKKIQKWGTKFGIHKDKCVFDERGWLNIVIVHNSDSDKSPYAYIDDWKPNSAVKAEERTEQDRQGFQPSDPIPDKDDSLPF